MTPLPSKEAQPPASPKKLTSWHIAGISMIVVGAVLIPTMFLTAIGGGLILMGVATITAAYLRANRGRH